MTFDSSRPRQRLQHPPVSLNFVLLLILFVGCGALAFLGLLPGSPLIFVFVFAGWIVSLCLHEYGHARTAFLGGDHTVARKGYLSLDFLHYVDPLGSLLLPALILIMGGFAFPGGAVYIQRNLLRSRLWESAVSVAGPAANLLLLGLLLVPFWLGLPDQIGAPQFWGGLAFLALLNITSTVFNLLPVPGFDGYGILRPWLPPVIRTRLAGIEPIAIMAVIALFLLVPGAARKLLGSVFTLGNFVGLDFNWVRIGLGAFYFWN
jgi:Zn-dependent protease